MCPFAKRLYQIIKWYEYGFKNTIIGDFVFQWIVFKQQNRTAFKRIIQQTIFTGTQGCLNKAKNYNLELNSTRPISWINFHNFLEIDCLNQVWCIIKWLRCNEKCYHFYLSWAARFQASSFYPKYIHSKKQKTKNKPHKKSFCSNFLFTRQFEYPYADNYVVNEEIQCDLFLWGFVWLVSVF